jgi:hypothetical protein
MSGSKQPASKRRRTGERTQRDPNVQKRGWDSWNELEKDTFFTSARKYGRNFDAITKDVGTKNYEQVRHFYYRVVKKINKMLKNCGAKLDKQDPQEVLSSLLCYWELRQTHKDEQSKAFAVSLNDLIEKRRAAGFPEVQRVAPQSRASEKSKQQQAPVATHPPVQQLQVQPQMPPKEIKLEEVPQEPTAEQIAAQFQQVPLAVPINQRFIANAQFAQQNVPENLTLQLVPKYKEIAELLSDAKHNPRLQVTVSAAKDVPYILEYLNKKWVHYVDGQLAFVATGPIRLYPVHEQWRDHPGWGSEDNGITAGSMYQLLGRPDIIRLEYAWIPKVTKRAREYDDITSTIESESIRANDNNFLLPPPSRLMTSIDTHGGAYLEPSPFTAYAFPFNPYNQWSSPLKAHVYAQPQHFGGENSLSSYLGDASCDGFGGQHGLEELECKNLYSNFEGSMGGHSLDSDLQPPQDKSEKGASARPPSFRDMLNK